mgnify:CR=1 FL=1
MSCKYKNIFGKPKEGVHFHVFGIAIVDLSLTVLLAYLISRYKKINFLIVLTICMLVAIIIHYIFCVKTSINKIIFDL